MFSTKVHKTWHRLSVFSAEDYQVWRNMTSLLSSNNSQITKSQNNNYSLLENDKKDMSKKIHILFYKSLLHYFTGGTKQYKLFSKGNP